MNWIVRIKNPWFWVGLIGVFLAAIGVTPEALTSWQAVYEMLAAFVQNPAAIGAAVMAILGLFVDPTTAGLKDSARAMKYTKPNKG